MPEDTHPHTKTQYASVSSPPAVMYLCLYDYRKVFLPGLMLFYAFQKNNEVIKRLGYVCNPLKDLKEGTETSRRRIDELGSRLERPIHFECKLNEPMHIGMRLLHPAAADHSVSINRQQVQRIFRFSLRSRAGARPLSGGTGAVATGRDVSVPSFRERGLHT